MAWLQLAHKTAIVTGAGSGIGAAVAQALAAERCRVVLADRDGPAMEAVITQGGGGGKISRRGINTLSSLCVECDVTDPDQVSSLLQKADDFAMDSKGPNADKSSTLLVNCAGITRDNWVASMTLDEFDQVLDVNLKGTFLTCRAFLDQDRMQRILKDSGDGFPATGMSIVNMGSIVSELGNFGQANYAASKGGVLGLTRALAKESAHRQVRVNAVVPGFIDTPMAQAVPEEVKAQIIPKIPLQRFGRPDEVADLVTFLLSARSSYITGESIQVTGMISL